jgi:acyl-CoA hydrolase
MEARPASQSIVTMTELVLPTHTNALKSAFGGVIMSWIDIAAAISAQRHSGLNVVTASIDAMNFIAPVYVGWVVNLKACVNFVSRTSMEVGVRADAEDPRKGKFFHLASAYTTFVAVDDNGKPVACPPLLAVSEAEKRRYAAAEKRRALRLQARAIKEGTVRPG